MKSFIIFAVLVFLTGSALAQEHAQNQPAQPQSPPQGWYQQQSGTTSFISLVFFFSKDSGWICGGNNSFFHTIDGGSSWIKCTTIPSGWTSFRFLDYNTGFAFAGDSIIKTTDAGLTWSKPKFGIVNGIVASTSIGDTIFTLAHGIGVSTDRGESWRSLPVNFLNTVFPYAFAFSDSKHGWVMGGQQNFPPNQIENGAGESVTTDGGQTWTPVYSGIHYDISALFAYNNNLVFAGGNGIYTSTNRGTSWIKDSVIGQLFGVEAINFSDSLHGWAVGGVGFNGAIIGTTDAGQTWHLQLNNGLDQIFFYGICSIDSLEAWAVGDKGQIYHTINGGISWVRQYLPFDTLNPQTYPNPANEKMTLGITLPLAQHVTIQIMDITGKLIETPVMNMIKETGVQFIPLDIHSLDAGTYMLHISTECYDDAVKFIKISP